MSRTTLNVVVAGSAKHLIQTLAVEAWPRETGGILLGNYPDGQIAITHAVGVPDPRATRVRYRRDAEAAAQALDLARQSIGDPSIGYIGEWHSHPIPSHPSNTDRNALRQLATHSASALVLLVAARTGKGFTMHPVIALPNGDSYDAPPMAPTAEPQTSPLKTEGRT